MENRCKYIKLFTDVLETWEPLTDEECGRLFRALLRYQKTGEETELTGNERLLYPLHKRWLEEANIRYEARAQKSRENGLQGGRPFKDSVC